MTPPTRYALVPVDIDLSMLKAALENSLRIMKRDGVRELMPDEPGPRPTEVVTSAWTAMLAASPNAGRVTAEMLERAARARSEWAFPDFWDGAEEEDRQFHKDAMRAALTVLGLQVDAPAGEVVDG